MIQKGSIKKWLVSIISLISVCIIIVAVSIFSYWHINKEHKNAIALSKTISTIVSQNAAKIIFLDEVGAAADITTSLRSFLELNSLLLYNSDGKVVFKYSKNDKDFFIAPLDAQKKETLITSADNAIFITELFYQDTKLGFVRIESKITSLVDVFKSYIFEIILLTILLFVLALLLANYYSKKFTSPIIKLVDFLANIDLKKITKIRTEQNNEYGYLYQEVNNMLERIESSQKSLQIAAVAFETQSGITITDQNNKILNINKAFTQITGYTKEEAIGKNPSILQSGLYDKKFYKSMFDTLAKYNYWSGEIYNKHKSGKIYPEHLIIQTVLDEKDEITHFVASFIDLSLQKISESKLSFLEKYDSLTGLANKKLLCKSIQEEIDSKKLKKYGAIICFDIKEFKLVNEAFGHDTGDILLHKIADRLREITDIRVASKIGSNEFCLWSKDAGNNKSHLLQKSKVLAEHVINTITKPYEIKNETVHIIIKVGIHIYSRDEKDAFEIIRKAESALFDAKKEDIRLSFSDENYQAKAQLQLDTYTQLILALKENQLELYYQPQYDYKSKILGVEALIRWNHPTQKLVPPNNFIPLAEKSELIIDIGDFVIQESCKQLSRWQDKAETAQLTISINISTKHFMSEALIKTIQKEVKSYKINPKLLKIELTESIAINDMSKVVSKMKKLKNIGVQISLDDFGTGYSSLQYLQNLPLNQIKVDQSFVKRMLQSQSDLAIIKSLLLISDALRIELIAEGVETKEQFDFLKKLGCKNFQGYYFCKPKKIDKLELY